MLHFAHQCGTFGRLAISEKTIFGFGKNSKVQGKDWTLAWSFSLTKMLSFSSTMKAWPRLMQPPPLLPVDRTDLQDKAERRKSSNLIDGPFKTTSISCKNLRVRKSVNLQFFFILEVDLEPRKSPYVLRSKLNKMTIRLKVVLKKETSQKLRLDLKWPFRELNHYGHINH